MIAMRSANPDAARARHGRSTGLDRALDLAAAGLLGMFLAVAVPLAVLHAGRKVVEAAQAHESLDEARARVHGVEYTRAIDQIRRELPPGDAYLLVMGGEPKSGGAYWVRYDLAPRRAFYFGRLDDFTSSAQVRHALPTNLRHVVVAFDSKEPPRLYERYRFLEEIDRRAREGSSGR
jgi:hypothetical protein